ncbi:MAG TPA: YihY/virulence factor BrkB family protein [Acidimicrobiia bacterium]|jgi:YihY family inner membrane protein
MKRLLGRLDEYQQRRRWLAFPLAVNKKFGDDQAGNLAALIAYYGFFSLFPLLLVLVTILGFALQGNPSLQHDILNSTFKQFPVIGDQLQRNVHSLNGNALALTIGLVGTLYGGLGVANAAQNALNEVWDVPRSKRPGFLPRLTRSLLLLAVVGGGILVATLVNGFAAGRSGVDPVKVGAFVLATALNVVLFVVAFRVMTARDVAVRDLVPGAIVAALAFQVLQIVGGYYITHTVKNASSTYGFFAIVIGLLAWIYLQAQVLLYAAEVNVVRVRGLYPRALFPPPPTDADRRAYQQYADAEDRVDTAAADAGEVDANREPARGPAR